MAPRRKERDCPRCRGEQFVKKTLEDGKRIDAWCPHCWGSGVDPRDLPTVLPQFVFAR
jgi:hypothetical protein